MPGAAPYGESVFVNCPFDDRFEPLLHAIILTLAAHGLSARSALEAHEGPRLQRIWSAISASKYSVHDLSRLRGEGPDNLARFNMPFELGFAVALRFQAPATGRSHHWYAMFEGAFEDKRVLSDLAGFDLGHHESTVESVIRTLCQWLGTLDYVPRVRPAPRSVLEGYARYEARLKMLRARSLGVLHWQDLVESAFLVWEGEA